MNLEELKKSWEAVDRKVNASTLLNEHMLRSIFSRRIASTVDSIHRLYVSFYAVLAIEMVFLIAILIGNPFDFVHRIQYVPYALLLIGVVVAFLNLALLHRKITRLSADEAISDYLRHIVRVYDENRRYEKWFGLMLFAVALLVPFTFLPKKILAGAGLGAALLDTLIPTAISLFLFYGAHKLGLFRNRHKDRLKDDLREWESLRSLANGLD